MFGKDMERRLQERKENRRNIREQKKAEKLERKRIRREKGPIRRFSRWLKNIGTSSSGIFIDWFVNQSLVDIVNGEVRFVKEIRDYNKRNNIKITPVEYIKKASKNEVMRIVNQVNELYNDTGGEDLFEDLKGHAQAFVKGLKSGDLNTRYGFDMFEDDEDIKFLFSNENDDFFGDDKGYKEDYIYNKGDDNMNLREIKEKNFQNLKIVTLGESLSLLNGIDSLNEKLISFKEELLEIDEMACNEEVNDFSNEKIKCKYDDLEKEIYNVLKTVSNNGKVEELYIGPLSSIIASTLSSRLCRMEIEECSKRDLEDKVYETEKEIDAIGLIKVADNIERNISDIDKAIEDIEDDKSYDPDVNELEERISDLGGFKSVGEVVGRRKPEAYGEAVGVIEGAATLVDLVQVLFALPINILHSKKIEQTENKFGSNFIIKQPMIVSNNMSTELAGKFSKALEIKYLLETKALLEATTAKMDGGSVVNRAKTALKYLSPANIKLKDAKLYDKSTLDYNEIIGVFSENKNPLGNTTTDSLFILPSFSSVIHRNMDEFDFYTTNSYFVNKGEAGEFIQHGRDALPSYMTVHIDYVSQKNITNFNIDTKSRETMIGLQIVPRSLNGVDIVDTLADVNKKRFSNVTVTSGERNTMKNMKNLLKFWKKRGSVNELKVLSSNSFSDIVKKVENIATPLFHLVITMDEYVSLKDKYKMDVMQSSVYREMMKSMPLISLSIVDEDTNMIYLSEGDIMNFYKHDIDEYIDSISQYEKDLKTIIKYNQYR